MEQKFVKFEEALEKLGIAADKLNELRESGTLRAYRDGASWKFRADEIQRMATEGIPDIPEPSDIGLVSEDELVQATPPPDSKEEEDLELQLAEESDIKGPAEPDESALELQLEDTDAMSSGSEIELAGQEDTVTTSDTSDSSEEPSKSGEASDSILLSEEELGESVTGSPSTIIGRKELDLEDADLELELADDVTDDEDTKLSAPSGASDVLSAKVSGSGVLDEEEDLSDAKRAFKDLEELEIDLAAESSLALSASDISDLDEGSGGKPLVSNEGGSDLKLDTDVANEDESNMGSTDVPLEELAAASSQGSDIDLGGDEDLILSDAEGSDITLDSGDSGINLVSPSDSGLALDDIPLDVGGSAILSSLSLEGSDPEISLLGSESNLAQGSGAELQTDDDFQLTPLSEGGPDEGDSSSQVIALDADLGEFEESAGPLLEGDFDAEAEEGVVLTEDFGDAAAGDLGVGGYAGEVAMVPAAAGTQYTLGNILLLMVPSLLLILGGIMMLDMVRNMWTWNDNYTITSSMLEALLGLFGLN